MLCIWGKLLKEPPRHGEFKSNPPNPFNQIRPWVGGEVPKLPSHFTVNLKLPFSLSKPYSHPQPIMDNVFNLCSLDGF